MRRRDVLSTAGLVSGTPLRIGDFGLRNPQSAIRNQTPALSPQVFAQRIQRAQEELKSRKLDLLVVEPSTNFQYFAGYNPGRSERLILLMIPATGVPAIVCPSFEVERIKRNTTISDARGWEEQEDPWLLARETVVLIDAGSRVEGYTSDITRTIWFGDAPSDEFKKVYNIVHDAQTAAIENAKPGVTQCQQVDRAARKVITDAGYGQYFTHRLGHGMGMDGHEPPYMVEGNTLLLEPGIVFTDEPGIYELGKFGVRIEDDCMMTPTGVEVLSHRPTKL